VAPRLAIVDVWMPEVDGIELVERMRTQSPGVPIIVISGHGTIETAVRVIRLGAFDSSRKPFPLDALLNVVGRALGTNADATATAAAGRGALRARDVARPGAPLPAADHRAQRVGERAGTPFRRPHRAHPAALPPGSGIVFGSILSGETVPALIDHIDSTEYATTLVRAACRQDRRAPDAAFHAYGITNVLVKMQAEVPILDGSALELCALLDDAGILDQTADRRGRSSSTSAMRSAPTSPAGRASASSPPTRSSCTTRSTTRRPSAVRRSSSA